MFVRFGRLSSEIQQSPSSNYDCLERENSSSILLLSFFRNNFCRSIYLLPLFPPKSDTSLFYNISKWIQCFWWCPHLKSYQSATGILLHTAYQTVPLSLTLFLLLTNLANGSRVPFHQDFCCTVYLCFEFKKINQNQLDTHPYLQTYKVLPSLFVFFM